MTEVNNVFEKIEEGKTYKFEDIIHDSFMTRYGEMNVIKLVNGDKILTSLKAPRQLLAFLKLNPSINEFTVKKIVKDGEYINYVFC